MCSISGPWAMSGRHQGEVVSVGVAWWQCSKVVVGGGWWVVDGGWWVLGG